MKTKHPDGPYGIAAQDSKDDRLEIIGHGGVSIALVSKQDPQEDGGRCAATEVAIARLFAAAPELLAAAGHFFATVEAMTQAERDALPNGIVNTLGLAEAAIAKAEGRT